MTTQPTFGPQTVAAVSAEVIGRTREIELVVASLMEGRHLLLEGPPGTGKSTILRSVACSAGQGFNFVEGNAELTPTRLVGHFDPAQVLEAGYSSDIWVDGPLTDALRRGSLIFIEEINRVPEETLNLLVTVMSERELTVPRLGRVAAHPDFRIVAAMNPFDAVGTSRISGAIYDRVCRVGMGYQSDSDEAEIALQTVQRALDPAGAGDGGDHAYPSRPYLTDVVAVVRATRDHPDVEIGSSVRGAVDLLLVGHALGQLRQRPATDHDIGLDAALTALSGRVQVGDTSMASAEEIITDLWNALVGSTTNSEVGDEANSEQAGKESGRTEQPGTEQSDAGRESDSPPGKVPGR